MAVSLTLRAAREKTEFVRESPLTFAYGDTRQYSLDISNQFNGTPSSPLVTASNETDGGNEANSIVTVAAAVQADDTILFTLAGLRQRNYYTVSIKFTISGETLIKYLRIWCE